MRKRQKESEKGFVLVLLAGILFAAIGLLAMAVDTGLVSSARTQQQVTSNFVALSALDTYMENASEHRHSVKAANALTRAQQLVQASVPANSTSFSYHDASHQDDLVLIHSGETWDPNAATNGYISPGTWYFDDPGCSQCAASHPWCASCACQSSSTFHGACFEPVTNEDTSIANAFRVTLATKPSSGIHTIFARLLGQETGRVTSMATASLIPRHAIFLIDITRSTVSEGYSTSDNIPDDDEPTGILESYFMTVDPAKAPAKGINAACANYPDATSIPDWSSGGTPIFKIIPDQFRYEALVYPDYPGGVNVRSTHAADQYRCIYAPNTYDEDDDFQNMHFLTDMANAPEPLYSILTGVRSAMGMFVSRAVRSDRISIIGFDDQLLRSRVTWDESAGHAGLVSADHSDAEFETMYNAIDLSFFNSVTEPFDRASGWESLLNRKFMFPRLYGHDINVNSGQRNGASTDIPSSLLGAYQILSAAPDFKSSDNFIVLFSDGATNCYPKLTHPLYPGVDGSVDRCKPANKQLSTTATTNFIKDVLIPNKVSLHFFITGESNKPHTLVIPDREHHQCLTEEHAIPKNISLVDTTKLSGGTRVQDPKLLPNSMYGYVAKSNGLWAPLRPPCKPASLGITQEQCENDRVFIDAMDAKCDEIGANDSKNLEQIRGGMTVTLNGSPVVLGPEIVDDDGRLLCDPLCRSKEKQSNDYIGQIMSANPFVLVE